MPTCADPDEHWLWRLHLPEATPEGTTFPGIDPRRKGWLRALMDHVSGRLDGLVIEPEAGERFEPWLARALRALCLGPYPLAPAYVSDSPGRGASIFLSVVTRQLALIGAVGRLTGRRPSAVPSHWDIAVLLTARRNKLVAALREARALAHDEGREAELLRDTLRECEKPLKGQPLDDDHPLLDSSFHRLLVYDDSVLLARLARLLYTESLVREHFEPLVAKASVRKLSVIEAVAGLVAADGDVDKLERRLIKALVEVGGFTKTEEKMIQRALETSPGQAPSPEALAKAIESDLDRRFVLRMVIFAALLNGQLNEGEERYILQLAHAFEIPYHEVIRLHVEIVHLNEQQPELLAGLASGNILSRNSRAAYRLIERVVRRNADAIGTEVQQTGDLVHLLARRARGDVLDDAEAARMRDQLKDLARTIPSLALLAAPGGSVLLPILDKVLPFSLLPSEFQDQDEPAPPKTKPEA